MKIEISKAELVTILHWASYYPNITTHDCELTQKLLRCLEIDSIIDKNGSILTPDEVKHKRGIKAPTKQKLSLKQKQKAFSKILQETAKHLKKM